MHSGRNCKPCTVSSVMVSESSLGVRVIADNKLPRLADGQGADLVTLRHAQVTICLDRRVSRVELFQCGERLRTKQQGLQRPKHVPALMNLCYRSSRRMAAVHQPGDVGHSSTGPSKRQTGERSPISLRSVPCAIQKSCGQLASQTNCGVSRLRSLAYFFHAASGPESPELA